MVAASERSVPAITLNPFSLRTCRCFILWPFHLNFKEEEPLQMGKGSFVDQVGLF
jgi:hypothetical protein